MDASLSAKSADTAKNGVSTNRRAVKLSWSRRYADAYLLARDALRRIRRTGPVLEVALASFRRDGYDATTHTDTPGRMDSGGL